MAEARASSPPVGADRRRRPPAQTRPVAARLPSPPFDSTATSSPSPSSPASSSSAFSSWPAPSGNAVTEDDRVVLELFASQAVNAIRLARAHETTRLGSLRDPLTGVANHGHFQETLYREVTRHERSGERLVLLMVDLDDFKAVNDRYGHPAGDTVLKAVVARLLASVREMDTVARYGGEEFSIILPQTDATSGHRVAERLRAAVAASPLPGRAPRAASADRLDRPRRLSRRRGLEGGPRRVRRQGPLRREEDREEPGREVHEGARHRRGAPHRTGLSRDRRVTAGQSATAKRRGQAAASPA